jgi:hypothetical protein
MGEGLRREAVIPEQAGSQSVRGDPYDHLTCAVISCQTLATIMNR